MEILEQVLDKVSFEERRSKVIKLVRETLRNANKANLGVEELITLLSGTTITFTEYLVEQAYIAGTNRSNLSETQRHPLQESGEILTLARNYVKDKGLRL